MGDFHRERCKTAKGINAPQPTEDAAGYANEPSAKGS